MGCVFGKNRGKSYEEREMWKARKHGELVFVGAGGGICIGGFTDPASYARAPRWPSNRLNLFPPSSVVQLPSPERCSGSFAQLAMGCFNPPLKP